MFTGKKKDQKSEIKQDLNSPQRRKERKENLNKITQSARIIGNKFYAMIKRLSLFCYYNLSVLCVFAVMNNALILIFCGLVFTIFKLRKEETCQT